MAGVDRGLSGATGNINAVLNLKHQAQHIQALRTFDRSMLDDRYDQYVTKWDPRRASQVSSVPEVSWAPNPLAREMVALLLMTPLTPIIVAFLASVTLAFQQAVERGHFDLWALTKVVAITSLAAVFAGFGESLLGSFVIVVLGGILARLRIDSIWVSLVLGALVGLTVPDAPSVLLGIAHGQSWHDAIAHRTWRGFWPFFGIAATMMSLLCWKIAIRPRRMERLALEREAASAVQGRQDTGTRRQDVERG